MSEPQDTDLQARIAAMERELAELRKRQAAAVESTGEGVAFAGDRNFVNTGSIGGGVQVIHGNVYNGPPTTDPAEALRIYCRVLVAGSRYLPLRGVDVGAADPGAGQKTLNLAHVYIALDTKTSVPVEEKAKRRREDAPAHARGGQDSALPALEAAATNRCLVLLGDPGSGKSTFVMHLAHCLAAHGLEPAGGWLDHLPGWPQPDVVPIVIVLRDFARWYAAQVAEAEAAKKSKPEVAPGLMWAFIGERLDRAEPGIRRRAAAPGAGGRQGAGLVRRAGRDRRPCPSQHGARCRGRVCRPLRPQPPPGDLPHAVLPTERRLAAAQVSHLRAGAL